MVAQNKKKGPYNLSIHLDIIRTKRPDNIISPKHYALFSPTPTLFSLKIRIILHMYRYGKKKKKGVRLFLSLRLGRRRALQRRGTKPLGLGHNSL
jgi:hypothetical protein